MPMEKAEAGDGRARESVGAITRNAIAAKSLRRMLHRSFSFPPSLWGFADRELLGIGGFRGNREGAAGEAEAKTCRCRIRAMAVAFGFTIARGERESRVGRRWFEDEEGSTCQAYDLAWIWLSVQRQQIVWKKKYWYKAQNPTVPDRIWQRNRISHRCQE